MPQQGKMINNIEQQRFFSANLLDWYLRHKRDLPWRRSRDPYHIWVSEIMLQQTRVDTVIPYYERFTGLFPTIEALAEAPEEEVLKAWEGLGYYSRARNLQAAAREVAASYGGRVPDDAEEIRTLKGVGPYTAGAIMSIAFNRPEPAVDGNVMRVLARFFHIEMDIAKGNTRAYMERLARELIPDGAAGDFNQALMELGALICTPRSPQCLVCPVFEQCAGRIAGVEEQLPIKQKAKPPKPEYRAVALVVDGVGDDARIVVRQRPESGLLARMWELPHVMLYEAPSAVWNVSEEQTMDLLGEALFSSDGLHIAPQRWFMNIEHTFSHLHWNMRVYLCGLGSGVSLPEPYSWMRLRDLDKHAFPNVFLRIIRSYMENVLR